MELQIAAKPLVLCQLANTNEEFGGLATVFRFFPNYIGPCVSSCHSEHKSSKQLWYSSYC